MQRFLNSVLIVVFVFSLIPPDVFLAQDGPILDEGIQDFGYLLNQLWNFEEFNQLVPLSNVTPSQILQLDQLFSYAFTQAKSTDETITLGDGVEIHINIEYPSEIPNSTRVTLEASKQESLSLYYINQPEESSTPTESGTCADFEDNDDNGLTDGKDPKCTQISIIGGNVNTTFALNTVLTFVEDENGKIYLSGDSPILNVAFTANDNVNFKSKFNIADIDVNGTATYNGSIETQIIDENNDGRIYVADWHNSILDDLIRMDFANQKDETGKETDDVAINLTLTLDDEVFDEGTASDNLLFSIEDLSDRNTESLIFAPEELADFLTVNTDELLTGLGSYAVALDTMWLTGEGDLPFIKERLHNLTGLQEDLFDQFIPGNAIRSLVRRQGDAFVYCGTEQTIPLQGDPKNGGTLYCQAFTPYDPEVISWKLGGIEAVYEATIEDTVGINPTGWAIFTDVEPGAWKDIEVTYEYEETQHVVEPRVQSVGELKTKLEELQWIEEGSVVISYNSGNSTLIFDIEQIINGDPLPGSKIHLDFGSQFQKDTNIANIHQVNPNDFATFTLEEPIVIHAGYGTILVDDVADITPAPRYEGGDDPETCSDGIDNPNQNEPEGDSWVDIYDTDCPKLEDRFFISKENPESDAVIFVGNFSIDGLDKVQLAGQVGSVEADLIVNSYTFDPAPSLKLSIIPTVIEVEGSDPIPNALGTRNFISNPIIGKNILREQSLDAKVDLTATLLNTQYPIEVTWNNNELGVSDTLPFKILDIAPSVIGTHEGEQSETILVDSSTDFPLQLLGIEEYAPVDETEQIFVPRTIYNLTTGASCTGFMIISTNSLECSSPLSGDQEKNYWTNGDEHMIEGDPRALLTLVEDSLFSLASQMYNHASAKQNLPVVGINMQELVPQIGELMEAINNFRNGDVDPRLQTLNDLMNETTGIGITVTFDGSNLTLQYLIDPPQTPITQPFSLNLSLENAGTIIPLKQKGSNDNPTIGGDVLTAKIEPSLNLSLNIPLSNYVSLDDVEVLKDTHATVVVDVDQTGFDVNATIGSMDVGLGSGAGISLSVSSDPTIYESINDQIAMTFTITNTGSKNLEAPFLIYGPEDTEICSISAPDIFAPDETVDCPANISASEVPEFAYAGATYQGNHVYSLQETVNILPYLELEYSADTLLYDDENDTVVNFTITNNGEENLTGIVLVDDTDNPVDCDSTPIDLSPNTSNSCELTITEAQTISIKAKATKPDSTNIFSKQVELDINSNPSPSLLLQVTTLNQEFSAEGDHIDYTFLLTNNGNIPLLEPVVIKNSSGEPVCEDIVTPLNPGQNTSCQYTYLIQSADLTTETLAKTFYAEATYDSASDPIQSNSASAAVKISSSSKINFDFKRELTVSAIDTLESLVINSGDSLTSFEVAFNIYAPDGGIVSRVDGVTDTNTFSIDTEIKDALGIEPINPSLITLALPMLGNLLEDNLDADRWQNKRIPLAGSDLSVGLDFINIAQGIEANGIPLETFFGDWENKTVGDLCSSFGDSIVLKDSSNNLLDCTANLEEIGSIEFNISIERDDLDPISIPFDIGLPGVPLESTEDTPVSADTTYNLNVTIGIDQFIGPYIENNGTLPLLTLDSTLSISEEQNCTFGNRPTDNFFTPDPNPFQENYPSCFDGIIGLLEGKLYDNNSEITLYLITGDSLGKFTYSNYLNGSEIPTGPNIDTSSGNLNLAFETTFDLLPTIVGEIKLSYANGEFDFLTYNNVYMNIDFFGFMGEAVSEVQKYTKPLQPVIDTLTAPLPVISDMATLVGQNPISLMSIMESMPSNKLTMLTRLANMVNFLNNIPADKKGIWLELSGDEANGEPDDSNISFEVEIDNVLIEECVSEIERTGDIEACDPDKKYEKFKKMNKDEKIQEILDQMNKDKDEEDDPIVETDWSGAGISIPILSDTSQIYGMLMGIDATLVRVDLGTVSATASLEYSYGPFLVGPVPVEITIGGSATLQGRFAMGFDTYGLRSVLRGDDFSANELINGIFIDDLDAYGNDVPEISLEVGVYAGASVSISIIEAGIRAGVTFTISLDWKDDDGDGKLRIQDIYEYRHNPICLFTASGDINFYIEFYLKFDFWLFSTTLSWRPLDVDFNLFEIECEPPDPILASISNQQFILHIGDFYDNRDIYEGEINEKIIVRQLSERGQGCAPDDYATPATKYGPTTECKSEYLTGTWISVTFEGILQYFFLEGDEPGEGGYTVYARAGDGDDQISLLTGSVENENGETTEYPFTIDADIGGGPGNDRIDTGGGDDEITGGSGNDNINGRGGNDTLSSESGENSLDGGPGNDVISGGVNNDTINGGPGNDYISGGEGHDSLMGGPELKVDSNDPLENSDFILGGPGMDSLEGGLGDDCLFGEDQTEVDLPETCDLLLNMFDLEGIQSAEIQESETGVCMDIDNSNADYLIGGEDDDYLYGGIGNDVLEGENGSDSLYGQAGNDDLFGGRGSDKLYGGECHDWLQGDQGNDDLYGDIEIPFEEWPSGTAPSEVEGYDDDLMGGEGQDRLFGNGGNDILLGDLGILAEHDSEDGTPIPHLSNTDPDHVETLALIQAMTAAMENPNIPIEEYNDLLVGGSGVDFMFGEAGSDTMLGQVGDDYLEGNNGNDKMDGNGGADTMRGGPGNDIMYGGGGWTEVDEILDDNSKSPHDGDDGPDKMWGNSGDDIMFGNRDDDEINGNLGNDYIEGNEGQDTIHGSPGADIIRGGHNIPNQEDDGDTLFGDEGIDYIEGNAGQDTIHGGLGDDLIIGGSNKAEEIDTGDFLYGDEGSDTILGDNGAFDGDDGALIEFMQNPQILSYQLEEATENAEIPLHRSSETTSSRVDWKVIMIDVGEFADGVTEDVPDSYAGPDKIYGGPGDDLIFGQWEGYQPEPDIDFTVDDEMDKRDNLYGQQGQDLIIGDQGTVVCQLLEGVQEELRTKAPFLIDEINLDNTLHCTVTLEYNGEDPKPQDGDDLISGGENTDWLFGGGGTDLINGDEGNDRIFGGFGDDRLWGGPDHDHLWGGSGSDHLDVIPREASEEKGKVKLKSDDADPEIVFEWADAGDYTGIDYMYGGLGQDAMQADVAPKGPNLGDRMIDWIGVFNIYYLCPAQYGEGVITRSPSPQVIDFLVRLATSDGADAPGDQETSGYLEIAIVYQQYFKSNSHPPHSDTPGHFTCDP